MKKESLPRKKAAIDNTWMNGRGYVPIKKNKKKKTPYLQSRVRLDLACGLQFADPCYALRGPNLYFKRPLWRLHLDRRECEIVT